jgi:hypothetical protein
MSCQLHQGIAGRCQGHPPPGLRYANRSPRCEDHAGKPQEDCKKAVSTDARRDTVSKLKQAYDKKQSEHSALMAQRQRSDQADAEYEQALQDAAKAYGLNNWEALGAKVAKLLSAGKSVMHLSGFLAYLSIRANAIPP